MLPRGIERIGLQLYTLRNELEKDFEGTLARVAEIGYKEVEFAGYYNRSPKQVKEVLIAGGLSSPAAHVTLRVLGENWDKTVEAAAEIGHQYLICAFLFPNERRSLDDYKRHADAFNRAGEVSKKAGIEFGYHNHDFEFEPLDGSVPYDVLLKGTDPKLVKMELDLYWAVKAKQDPLKYFAAHPGRFPLFHVKDMDNTPKQFFTEVGRGVIDFKRIFGQGDKAGVKHYFVEQDQCPGPPLDSIKISFDYLKKLEF
jgi:sugar phosphate isomerase/epimerase